MTKTVLWNGAFGAVTLVALTLLLLSHSHSQWKFRHQDPMPYHAFTSNSFNERDLSDNPSKDSWTENLVSDGGVPKAAMIESGAWKNLMAKDDARRKMAEEGKAKKNSMDDDAASKVLKSDDEVTEDQLVESKDSRPIMRGGEVTRKVITDEDRAASVVKNSITYTLEKTLCGKKYIPPGYHDKESTAAKRLPEIIHIGQRKTGSTAVMRFLNLHPGVCVHRGSEIQFFMNDNLYALGLDYYKDRMPPTIQGQLTLEKSVYFFKDGPSTAERIHNFNSSVRLILQVRDPVARAVSDFHFCVRHGGFCSFNPHLNRTFEELVIQPDTGEIDENFTSMGVSRYADKMAEWLKYFTMDQIHIIDGDTFLQNPVQELYNLETFLGLDHVIDDVMFFFNATRGCYCAWSFGCVPDSGHTHPEVQPDVLNKLRRYFAPHNERFFKMIGRKFDW